MSNRDVQVSGSETAAQAVFQAELQSEADNGRAANAPESGSWLKLIGKNTGHKLYKNT